KYNEGLAIAQEKEDRLNTLVQQNAIAEFQLLEQQAQRIEYAKNAQATLDTIIATQSEIAEAEQRLANVDASYHKDIMTSLVEARKEFYSLQEAIKKAEEDTRMATILAPCDGRVYNLAVHTEGGIVTDAQPLMMVVPDDVRLQFEVYAENKDIGFIKVGQEAEVKVETFDFQKFGMIRATVEEISADAFDDNRDPEKNRKFRLLLKPEKEEISIGGHTAPLVPGMGVSAEIKIKEKRIIDFFLDPFRRYTSESLRER
ncbi:MAG: HlyD family type I secretion periplasmic adaptor subunit, partial [Lachnospiraceae bacterium]|nr:HlyD family type I secretion periplasmic adaptor subunit [Lachnospiraceae bacterium]